MIIPCIDIYTVDLFQLKIMSTREEEKGAESKETDADCHWCGCGNNCSGYHH